MGKKKPLTKYQQFMADHLPGMSKINNWKWENGKAVSTTRKRSATEWRRLFKYRTGGWNAEKMMKARDAMESLMNADKEKSWEEVASIIWKARYALKYQGYIQMEMAFIEQLMMKSRDKELKKQVKNEIAITKLKEKVREMNEPVYREDYEMRG